LHNILPHFKPALYLADVALSAAAVDKTHCLLQSLNNADDNTVKN